jgi:hypothetical protein
MHARNCAILIVTAVTLASPSIAMGQPPATAAQLTERIQRDFPPVWTKATDSPYISDCSFEQSDMTGNPRITQAIVLKGRRGTQGQFVWSHELTAFDQSGSKPFEARLSAINPRYEFKLHKPFGKTDWLLLAWRLTDEEKPDYRPPVTYTPEIFAPFSHHLAFGGLPLDKLVTHSGWKVNTIQASPADAAMVRVSFSFTESTRPGFTSRYEGWLDLDPSAGWCVRRSDYQLKLDALGKIISKHFVCDNHCTVIAGAIPVVTHVQCDDSDVKPDGSFTNLQRRIFRFDTRYPDKVPETEFTMTAFGLPEPVGVTWEKPTPRYVWFLLAAGGFALLMLGFRYVARRCTAKPVAV